MVAYNNDAQLTRFDRRSQMYNTNFSVGQDKLSYKTVYERDYGSERARQGPLLPQVPKALSDDAGPVQKINSKKSKAVNSQNTNFTFGNDDLSFNTVYAGDYSNVNRSAYRRKSVPPQPVAEILPTTTLSLPGHSHPIDYNHFGRNVSKDIYAERLNSLRHVKDIHTHDSVRLNQNHRKMMTRAMMDYQRPLDRMHGSIKLLMVQNITPDAREDSIWQSVNNGGQFQMLSEASQAYRWPLAAPRSRWPKRSNHSKSA